MKRPNSPRTIPLPRPPTLRALGHSKGRTQRRLSKPTNTDSLARRQVAVIIPNGLHDICGVTDYAVGLTNVLALLGCTSRIFAFGSMHRCLRLWARVQAVVQLFRMRPRLIVINYVQFGYGTMPVQPFLPFVVFLASMSKHRVLTVWHEPPELGSGWVRSVRRLLERGLCRRSDVILLADDRARGALRDWGCRDIRISPIPSPFEASLYSQEPPSRVRDGVLLFGMGGRGVSKGFSPSVTGEVLTILRDAVPTIELLGIGPNWSEFPVRGMTDLGPAGEPELRRIASRVAGALFPVESPITPKSSSVSAMLTLGIPVVATGHASVGCLACDYYGAAIACLPSSVEAAEELGRLRVDANYRAERIARGREWYLKTASWSRVAEVLSRPYGNGAVDWLGSGEVDLFT